MSIAILSHPCLSSLHCLFLHPPFKNHLKTTRPTAPNPSVSIVYFSSLLLHRRRGGNIDENPRFGELAVMLGNLTNQKAAADAGWAGWTTSGEFVRRDLSDILDKAGALALERKRYQDKMEKFLTLKAATKTDTLVRKAKKREDWKRDLNANEVDVESDLRIFSLGREQQVLKPLSKALSTLLQTIERQYEMIMPFKVNARPLSY